MSVGHNWLSVYLNSSLSTFSNYTQLSTVIMGYSELSGKPLLVQPQHDLQVTGIKVWFGGNSGASRPAEAGSRMGWQG